MGSNHIKGAAQTLTSGVSADELAGVGAGSDAGEDDGEEANMPPIPLHITNKFQHKRLMYVTLRRCHQRRNGLKQPRSLRSKQ
ncbi:hypothetical protein EPI10_002059 [Gossypium australe]|uniref:Uncharacterized protein n=1 Tax=Gossypium australe TaxID=47621 RepID=A0A5B6VCU5_9ROSI|nr:hypothetical protein EPI10_002059 [Gossypium australe]